MKNITQTLKDGYKLAKTPSQFAQVKQWHNKLSNKLATCNAMLDECDKLDAEFEKVAKRMGIK